MSTFTKAALAAVCDAARDARDALQALLETVDVAAADALQGYMTAVLGPRGEWTPAWLVEKNAELRARFPFGAHGDPGPDWDGDPGTVSRRPLVLIGSIITPLISPRSDLTPLQRECVQNYCHDMAYGANSLTLIRDHNTGIARIAPVWPDGVPTVAGEYVLAVADLYPGGADLRAAVEDYYARDFGAP